MSTLWLIIILIGVRMAASTTQPRSPGVDGSPASSPMDTILEYNMTNFPGRVQAACFSGHQDGLITAIILSSHHTNTTIIDSGRGKMVSWASAELPSGLMCYNTYGFRYNVMAPFTDSRAPFVPDRLSFTLGKDEDLHLTFTTRAPQVKVIWQKEPNPTKRWKEAHLDREGRLIIPAGQLLGSGLYSVAPETSDDSHVPRTSIGTFSLLVRRCPEHRCGSDCRGWCPDCMNGGGCDESRCLCVCPPGLSGRLCHTRYSTDAECYLRTIGENCSRSQGARGLQVCLAAPYGCHCLPGYQGLHCDEGCGRGRWGVDCSQTCYHCLGDCHPETGSCNSRRAPCAGGDMGLPRLRTPPLITNLTEDSVGITFARWDPHFDDGQLAPREPIKYILRLLADGREIRRRVVSPPSATLADLEPGKMYDVQVVLNVKLDNYWCQADGFGRERVHTVHFNTFWPKEPGLPLISSTLHNKRLIFTWKASPTDQGSITYSYNIKTIYKACEESSPGSREWSEYSPDTFISLRTAPYTKVNLKVKSANEEGYGGITENSVDVPPDIPGNRIQEAACSVELKICQIKMKKNCRLENGPGLRVDYFLRPRNDSYLQYDFNRSDSSIGQFDSPSFLNISLPDELLPYTEYKVIMFPANDVGRNFSLKYIEDITTAPAEPGPVTQVRLDKGADFLTVKWAAPSDRPPKGRLHKYRISWRKESERRWKNSDVPSHIKSYIINDLPFNTKYIVWVRAQNADVSKWGPPVGMSATTKERPSSPRNLDMVTVGETEAVVIWEEPERSSLPITNYTISALNTESHEDQLLSSYSTTATRITITGLKAGRPYSVKVAACNELLCGLEAELYLWTKPKPLLPVKKVEWEDVSEPSISLPVFTTFPVWQWIVMADAQEPLTKDIAKAMVAASQGAQDYSVKQSVWVAASLYQDGKNITHYFHLGDNETYGNFHNRPLEQNRGYKLTVVTESRVGPHRTFYVSEPRTIPGRPAASHDVLLACLLTLMLLGTILTGVFCWCRMRRKHGRLRASREMTAHFHIAFEETESAEGGNQRAEASVVSKDPAEVEYLGDLSPVAAGELDFASMTRRVPRDQVEVFLARAVHSPDTEEEFKRVPSIMPKSFSDGEREENRPKNRYKNNLPYNETRVKLTLLPDQPFSDYINANYIQGHSRPNAYIATQGPKDFHVDTIGDFWRMIWESGTCIIIMLTNLMENGRVKVAQYWPEKEPLVKDDIQVTLVSTQVQMDFITRTLQVYKNGEVRSVKQYHYTAWPDHGVPQNPFGLTQMINIILEGKTTGPITVHCSAGIGRTGSIILTFFILDQLKTSGYIDTLQALVTLRNGRGRLLENMAQYIFSLKVLQELLTGTNTSYRCGVFPEELARMRLHQLDSDASLLHQQFKKLKSLPKDLTYKFAKDPACAKLNRNPYILPADSKMVFLHSLGSGLEYQYMNLVRVSSMEQKDSYLAGEHPQKDTLRNMWWLVYERRVPVWVLLHSFPDDHPEFPDVVPKEQPLVMSGLSLTVKDEFSFKNFVEYHIEITAPKSHVTTPHTCVVLKMKGWPHTEPLPETPEPLLGVIDKAKYIAAQKGHMLFTCKDGVEGCGLAMAILQIEDRINLFQEVDIYRSVLSIVYDRPQFIPTIEQYDFLHTAALDYLKTNQHYSNFV